MTMAKKTKPSAKDTATWDRLVDDAVALDLQYPYFSRTADDAPRPSTKKPARPV